MDSLLCLWFVFVAYGSLAWSFLVTQKFVLVFLVTVENYQSVGIFYLRRPDIGFVFFKYLRFPT